MEKFFEAGTLTQEELTAGLARAVRAGRLFPVFCASGLRNIGIQPLADAIVTYVAVAGRPAVPGHRRRRANRPLGRPPTTQPLVLWVWKTMADPFAGRITLFRVVSGVLKSDATVQNVTRDASRAVRPSARAAGQDTDARAGAACRRPRRGGQAEGHAHERHARRQERRTSHVPPIKFPEPVLAYAIEPKSRGDEDKIGPAMQRLREEDPSIGYDRDPQTHELLLSGQGQLHIEVTVAKLRRRFGVEVNLKPPRIPYRETITAKVEAHGRHKKQTGGHGQFGDCKIRMEPLAARRRLRVRRRHLRRRHSATVRPGRREGHPGGAAARLPGGLSGGRLPRDGVRRVVPRRRLERAVVQAGGPPGVQGRDVDARGRRCSSRS